MLRSRRSRRLEASGGEAKRKPGSVLLDLRAVLIRLAGVFFALALILTTHAREVHAVDIQEVESPGGIKAWLVEDHSLPLMAMRFAFLGGASQDPEDKPGVAHFLTTMLDEGAGDMDAAAFQEMEEELAIRMSFNAGRDTFTGNFQTLTENRDQASELLRLALNEPSFDADAVERMRTRLQSDLAFDSKDPNRIASRKWFAKAFAGHPYGRPVNGTEQTIGAVTREDLETYRANIFARSNLRVSVVGDITSEELGALLDKVFGALAREPKRRAVAEVMPTPGPQRFVTEMAIPQAVAQFGHAGIKRKDPDFVPAYVLNYILGGGGFSARLMSEVREKRGLAYSVYSSIYPYDHTAIFYGGVATKNDAISQTLDVIRDVLNDLVEHGPSQQELDDAKQHLTGAYALRFDTSSKIANQMLWIQIEELGTDYIDKRNTLIEAVTLDDVKRVAKRLLQPNALTVSIVGQPTGLSDDKG